MVKKNLIFFSNIYLLTSDYGLSLVVCHIGEQDIGNSMVRAISRSSQCSTTVVTKAVVCVIMSVG